jgi:large subunit ribosomal protein L17
MRHGIKLRRLNRDPASRRRLLRQLSTHLVTHGHIVTTLPRAKALGPVADRVVTWAKRGTPGAMRQLRGWLLTPEAAVKGGFGVF